MFNSIPFLTMSSFVKLISGVSILIGVLVLVPNWIVFSKASKNSLLQSGYPLLSTSLAPIKIALALIVSAHTVAIESILAFRNGT